MFSFTQLKRQHNLLYPVRQWLEAVEIRNTKIAYLICKLIPAQCPFERDIVVFGHKRIHIPPMCKLNPLYEELVGLRFKALCDLVDNQGLISKPSPKIEVV